ncbi:ribonuclease P family protein / Rpp14 family protein [Prunus dulcis]|uniref:Ribonuclease P family protein / Rpp14 family protein n=1 Tax=Prunus dulcis TaxID=3755 RepID=A0A4Y1R2V3_PRUDU|nr:ribonuclease P family protein / Rpp14 family protein [Prunus dulcis]
MIVILDPNRELVRKDPVIITSYNVTNAIKDSILENFGKCGLASSFGSFLVKYVNDITRLCIIRASREEYQKVWSAVTMVRSIAGCPVLFNLLDLSGSIKACKKAALKCDELKFEQHKIAEFGEPSFPVSTPWLHWCLASIIQPNLWLVWNPEKLGKLKGEEACRNIKFASK